MKEPSTRKNRLRLIPWLLAGLGVIVSLTLGVVYLASDAMLHRHYHVAVTAAPVATGADVLKRGWHVATTRGCLHCHGEDLGGGTVVNNAMIGTICAPNLTRGAGGLPASFRNEDWVRAIRHGIGPQEQPLVIMPAAEFAGLSEEDFGALLAYLLAAPPVDRASGPVRLGPLGRVLLVSGEMPLAANLINHAAVAPSQVTPGVNVAYGRYMAANCMGCHGPNLSGGKIHGGPPEWPPASNLTTVADGPLARWSEADFVTTLRTHRRPDGRELNEAMPRMFGQLTEVELRALWAYLRTVPPAPTGQRETSASPASSRGE